jgi:hypothetical protein
MPKIHQAGRVRGEVPFIGVLLMCGLALLALKWAMYTRYGY